MEKNKSILLTVFLVIAIIVIIVMGALLYMQKTEADRQIAELENNASELQETIDNLQEKIDNVSNIVTRNQIYNIRKTIKELEQDLAGDNSFIKTHRSCIVNLKNIKHIDFENNIIEIKNKKIKLLSRANKKALKERMREI